MRAVACFGLSLARKRDVFGRVDEDVGKVDFLEWAFTEAAGASLLFFGPLAEFVVRTAPCLLAILEKVFVFPF